MLMHAQSNLPAADPESPAPPRVVRVLAPPAKRMAASEKLLEKKVTLQMLSCFHHLNKTWRAWVIWFCPEMHEFLAVPVSSALLVHQDCLDREKPMFLVFAFWLACELLDSLMEMATLCGMQHDRSFRTLTAEKTYFAAWVPLPRQG